MSTGFAIFPMGMYDYSLIEYINLIHHLKYTFINQFSNQIPKFWNVYVIIVFVVNLKILLLINVSTDDKYFESKILKHKIDS